MRRPAILILLAAIVPAFAALPDRPAAAAALTVDSTGDGDDAAPGDGACDDGSGRCTLRAAIEEANALFAATAAASTIAFAIPAAPGTTPTIGPSRPLPTVPSS